MLRRIVLLLQTILLRRNELRILHIGLLRSTLQREAWRRVRLLPKWQLTWISLSPERLSRRKGLTLHWLRIWIAISVIGWRRS